MELTIENYKSNVLTPGNQLKVDWAHKWETDMDFAGLNSQLPSPMPMQTVTLSNSISQENASELLTRFYSQNSWNQEYPQRCSYILEVNLTMLSQSGI